MYARGSPATTGGRAVNRGREVAATHDLHSSHGCPPPRLPSPISRGCRIKGSVRVVKTISGMAQNFIAVDREQVLLMPPSLREWLPEDHFAWFVLATVERLDLSAFYRAYRPDGHGRAAFDPRLMVGVLFYSYSHGLMSSRGIERACVENVAVRVVAANQKPDHATIARFRQRHQDARPACLTAC